MKYPKNHREIVKKLLKGKFILFSDPLFSTIYENRSFYEIFFKFSFGYQLNFRNEFVYLTAKRSNEKLSRNIVIFLSALCYELNEEGKNFKKLIDNYIFDYDEVDEYLQKSVYKETIETIIYDDNKDDLMRFLNSLNRKNIIEFTDSNKHKFKFTKAIDVFFEFAIELAKRKFEEQKIS
jgi:hypothetical protein